MDRSTSVNFWRLEESAGSEGLNAVQCTRGRRDYIRRMPHYHLHLHNVHVEASDEEGMEFVDLSAARAKALEGIRDFLGHEVMKGKMDLRGQIDITDDGGVVLLTVRFDEAVEITKPS